MRSLDIGATGMMAQQLNVDVISNNIANMTTTGFKRQRAAFQDLIYQTIDRPGSTSSDSGTTVPAGLQLGLGVRSGSVFRQHGQGAIRVTDNPLDVAITGEGFLQVQLPNGDIAYTRDGTLQMNENGELVTVQGYLIDPGITIPQDALSIDINGSGEVLVKVPGQTASQNVGQIQLANFVNPAGLEAIGDLFADGKLKANDDIIAVIQILVELREPRLGVFKVPLFLLKFDLRHHHVIRGIGDLVGLALGVEPLKRFLLRRDLCLQRPKGALVQPNGKLRRLMPLLQQLLLSRAALAPQSGERRVLGRRLRVPIALAFPGPVAALRLPIQSLPLAIALRLASVELVEIQAVIVRLVIVLLPAIQAAQRVEIAVITIIGNAIVEILFLKEEVLIAFTVKAAGCDGPTRRRVYWHRFAFS